jgi:hypothetical protein
VFVEVVVLVTVDVTGGCVEVIVDVAVDVTGGAVEVTVVVPPGMVSVEVVLSVIVVVVEVEPFARYPTTPPTTSPPTPAAPIFRKFLRPALSVSVLVLELLESAIVGGRFTEVY